MNKRIFRKIKKEYSSKLVLLNYALPNVEALKKEIIELEKEPIVIHYNELQNNKENYEELKRLKKDPLIVRYNYLLIKLEQIDRIDNTEIALREIIDKYGNGFISDTNDLWFWYMDAPAFQYEIQISSKDVTSDSIASVYINMENSKKFVAILKEEQKDFEKCHKVVRGNRNIIDGQDRYYNTRFEYFRLCINGDQEAATKAMMQEEIARALEVEKAKEDELKDLDDCFTHSLIKEDDYQIRKAKILARK